MSEGLFCKSLVATYRYSDFIHQLLLFMSLTFMKVTKFPSRHYSMKLKCPCNNTPSFPYIASFQK